MNTNEIEIPQEVIIDDSELSPDALIKTVQRHRLHLLRSHKNDIDPNELLLLNSIASTAVAVKRITTDDNNSAADRDISKALVESLARISVDPFLATGREDTTPIKYVPHLPVIDIVLDETSRGLTIIEIKDVTDN